MRTASEDTATCFADLKTRLSGRIPRALAVDGMGSLGSVDHQPTGYRSRILTLDRQNGSTEGDACGNYGENEDDEQPLRCHEPPPSGDLRISAGAVGRRRYGPPTTRVPSEHGNRHDDQGKAGDDVPREYERGRGCDRGELIERSGYPAQG